MFSLDSIRACSPAIDPSPHLLCSFLPRKRRQGSSVSGIPAPTYEVIVSDVVVELFKSAIAVLLRISNLATEIGSGTSDKNHLVFGSGERPFGISGRHVFAGEICGLVASVARPAGNITGMFLDLAELSGKQLQLLKEVVPSLSRVAVVGDPAVNVSQLAALRSLRSGAIRAKHRVERTARQAHRRTTNRAAAHLRRAAGIRAKPVSAFFFVPANFLLNPVTAFGANLGI